MNRLTFVTGNQSKADQLARHLEEEVDHVKLDLTEIQTLDLDELITHKVKEAHSQLQKPVIVEDTALVFHALGNLPGPYIKWFLQEIGNEGICRLLDGYSDKSATAIVTFGYYDGKNLKIIREESKGKIANKPAGTRGFGWDPVFIHEGYGKTRGEMSDREHHEVSTRRIAALKLRDYLRSLE